MNHPGKERALDGGAGIGRITKGFLMKNFSTVDLVEQDKGFITEAKQQLASTNHRGQFFHCGNSLLYHIPNKFPFMKPFGCAGLQNFIPEEGVYDVIWVQWVLGHLTDGDLVTFLNRCM